MEYPVFKALLFFVSLVDGIYLGVLMHELGHAIAALIVTRQSIRVKVGTGEGLFGFSAGRLQVSLGLAGFRYGSTEYERGRESIGAQRFVIVGGPLMTLALTCGLAASLWQFEAWGWIWIALFGFFVANFRILFVSLWPIRYTAPDGSGEVWLSDSLDFWETGKR